MLEKRFLDWSEIHLPHPPPVLQLLDFPRLPQFLNRNWGTPSLPCLHAGAHPRLHKEAWVSTSPSEKAWDTVGVKEPYFLWWHKLKKRQHVSTASCSIQGKNDFFSVSLSFCFFTYLWSSIHVQHKSFMFRNNTPCFLPRLWFFHVLKKTTYDTVSRDLSWFNLRRQFTV